MPEGSQGGQRGQTKATVNPVFTNRLRELRDMAKQLQEAHQGQQQRPWMIPQELSTSILDIPSLHSPAFDRTEINDQYEQVTKDAQDAGTTGDIISLKLQMDYNASEERAFRARHVTLCRAFCLAHGRRFGQGNGDMWGQGTGIEEEAASFIANGGVE